MTHGIVDVFAFQEALLIEAVFGIAILTMIWVGFRRWLQHKDRTADRIDERQPQDGARIARLEARLKALEEGLPGGHIEPAERIAPPPE